MIRLTRLNNRAIALNADLIQWIEGSPDTVITLITGEKLVVLESCEQVVESVLEYRRQIGTMENMRAITTVMLRDAKETD